MIVYTSDEPQVPQVDINHCVAMINHQATGGIDEQLACAQAGYHGNAAWPIPNLSPPIQIQTSMPSLPQPPQVDLAPIINPPMPAFVSPRNEVVNTPTCDGINAWIGNNPLLAAGLIIGLWFLKGSSK